MDTSKGHRRTIKHYHEPGDLHELTFSCRNRLRLLTNDTWRRLLAESIDRALDDHDHALVSFVFMPEHVHLLVYPRSGGGDIPALLHAIKRSCSYRIKELLVKAKSPLLRRLTTAERGREVFRFWEKGPGYDRNLHTVSVVLASIDYIHRNPVTRGFCTRAVDWRWSSARWYESDRQTVDPYLPTIHGLPAEFF